MFVVSCSAGLLGRAIVFVLIALLFGVVIPVVSRLIVRVVLSVAFVFIASVSCPLIFLLITLLVGMVVPLAMALIGLLSVVASFLVDFLILRLRVIICVRSCLKVAC